MTTNIHFEIHDGSGIIGKDGKYRFATVEEAVRVADEFKNDPRTHNSNMSEDNVNYWKNKTYRVVKVTETVEVVSSSI